MNIIYTPSHNTTYIFLADDLYKNCKIFVNNILPITPNANFSILPNLQFLPHRKMIFLPSFGKLIKKSFYFITDISRRGLSTNAAKLFSLPP